MTHAALPMLKPAPGETSVECPKCRQRVSETCCAYQEFDYYKDCYQYITSALPKCPACDGVGTHNWNCPLNER